MWLLIEAALPEAGLIADPEAAGLPDPLTTLLDVYASPAEALRAVDELEPRYGPSEVVLAWLRKQAE